MLFKFSSSCQQDNIYTEEAEGVVVLGKFEDYFWGSKPEPFQKFCSVEGEMHFVNSNFFLS